MIGLSVSRCVAYMVGHKVPAERITKIIGGTCARNEHELNELVDGYCRTYWKRFPLEAAKLFWQLYAQGKIEQPRILDPNRRPVVSGFRYWAETVEEIVWKATKKPESEQKESILID